ncbi:MAG: Uma2 family endonuclease [Caldilineaceae bacterium]|nr:Uma2 family endonuclease [Caldilineaceae bacterium]MCB0128223.1 Uma2 family endonuclease [Caldilineaceae bacterium]
MSTVIEQLLQEPTLPSVLKRLQTLMEAEQARRQYFYDVVTEEQKAEFINGEIVVHSPVKLQHNSASFRLSRLLSTFVDLHQLGMVGHEKILITLERNDYEPDICFFNQDKAQAFTRRQMKFPAPDLVAEVLSESTEHNDRGIKFRDYAVSGVTEYWIIDPEQEMVEQYILQDDEYVLRIKSDSGEIRSVAVPGFTSPIRAIFDEQVNLATLRQIL